MNRWWIYQRERFPIAAHGTLIAAFSLSAVCYSMLRRGEAGLPAMKTVVVAFVSSLLFFLQLRIADEFKDAEDDARYRPYRPVPRGLVTLKELWRIGWATRLIQLVLALWLSSGLVILLVACWIYMELMSREFFVAEWLKAHPVHYLWTHMLVLPLIDLYVTACDWWPHGAIPDGMFWLLAVTFFNGLLIEIGRKLRAPVDEEDGVETYSALWGRRGAITFWLAAIAGSAVLALIAGAALDFALPVGIVLVLLLSGVAISARRFLREPVKNAGKSIELVSGVWGICVYLIIGLAPALWRLASR